MLTLRFTEPCFPGSKLNLSLLLRLAFIPETTSMELSEGFDLSGLFSLDKASPRMDLFCFLLEASRDSESTPLVNVYLDSSLPRTRACSGENFDNGDSAFSVFLFFENVSIFSRVRFLTEIFLPSYLSAALAENFLRISLSASFPYLSRTLDNTIGSISVSSVPIIESAKS